MWAAQKSQVLNKWLKRDDAITRWRCSQYRAVQAEWLIVDTNAYDETSTKFEPIEELVARPVDLRSDQFLFTMI